MPIHVAPAEGGVMHLIGRLRRGGAEKQLVCLSAALQRRGWPQSVVTFNPGDVGEAFLREAGVLVLPLARHWVKPLRCWRLARLVRAHSPRFSSRGRRIRRRTRAGSWAPAIRKGFPIFAKIWRGRTPTVPRRSAGSRSAAP